ncbi:3-methylornithyl-N6-L-lysine dehydrogenase PylD [Desulfobacterales bacterium HSG17]|nr:3-methylornithyl-N6-L-lysine dehydrogenase PylD [Desulfobacterales bacterium HSG17]
MTRLRHNDICHISSNLSLYDEKLKKITGSSILEIACHAWDVEKETIQNKIKSFSIHVIPITSGQGMITDFSQTVCDILNYLGFNAKVSKTSDISGLASAFENMAGAVMTADDDRFIGINLDTRQLADNSEATGRVFAAALDLIAGGIKNKPALVMGCGPVGKAGAEKLLERGADIALYDLDLKATERLGNKLKKGFKKQEIKIIRDFPNRNSSYSFILDATPSHNTIPDRLITNTLKLASPGVPLGVSEKGFDLLKNRLIHDKLELGVASMAVKMLL